MLVLRILKQYRNIIQIIKMIMGKKKCIYIFYFSAVIFVVHTLISYISDLRLTFY